MISDKMWQKYANIVNTFINDNAGLQRVIWLRKSNIPSLFGEDEDPNYTPIELKGLIQYNYIKVWPYNTTTPSGSYDEATCALYISKLQLEERGFLNTYGYWNFNTSSDRFIINGKVLRPMGDTAMSQAKDNPLLFFLILETEDSDESKRLLKTYLDPVNAMYESISSTQEDTTSVFL